MGLKKRLVGALPIRLADAGRRVVVRARLEGERRGALQHRINQRITVDTLPRRPRQPGSVWAVCMAKNEADIIAQAVRHMLEQGADGIIVVDNGSTDDTRAALDALASAEARVHVGVDAEPAFHQGMKMSYLSHLAWRAGADWVVPFDADEFWFAEGSTVAERLRGLTEDRAWCDYRNAYPLLEDGELDLDGGRPVQVDRTASAWLRIAFRTRRWVWVGEGNHDLRTTGPMPTRCLHMLHFSYRSLAQYSRKAEQGVAALEEAGKDDSVATHWRGWATLTEGERAAQWHAYLLGDEASANAFVGSDRVVVTGATHWRTWDPEGLFSDESPQA